MFISENMFKKILIFVFLGLIGLIIVWFLFFSKSFYIDNYAKGYDFNFVLNRTGMNEVNFMGNLTELLNQNISNFAKGDILLILGRLSGNDKLICDSLNYYEKSISNNSEENAIIYETIASIGCGKDRKEFLLKASNEWEKLNNSFRAEIDKKLAYNQEIEFKVNFSEIPEFNLTIPENMSKIIIGNSYIELNKSNILVSQVDRVNRDWLSYQIYVNPLNNSNLLTVFSERLFYNKSELLPEIGWHEGGRIKEIRKIGLKHKIASGTLVKKFGNKWYAPNENGVFMFEVPIDKVLYPTTRFLRKDLAVIIDTHGINMLVEQAIRYKTDVVVGCCDHPGKVKAAFYLSKKGIKTICFTDKYLPLLLGSKALVLGSPPIKVLNDSVILGKRPLEFSLNETFVVMNASDKPGLTYYKTPEIYFKQLKRFIDINVSYVTINGFNQMNKVVEKVREVNGNVLAVRVFNSNDYYNVRSWLKEDKKHKAILFHSVSYPYGYKLMKEFPEQTTFDDINPEFT